MEENNNVIEQLADVDEPVFEKLANVDPGWSNLIRR